MILAGSESGPVDPPERGERPRPPVLLLHGLFGAGGNLGALARALARHRRVIALDLRNHGDSPHDPRMDYRAMAEDVLETMAARSAWPAALVGHSMGGKAAMTAALLRPDAVTRLLVADIAPVAYHPRFRAFAAAMQALPLHPGLTRAAADAALADAVPDRAIRAFLLHNLRFRPGEAPRWRVALDWIAAALPAIEGWETPVRTDVPGGPADDGRATGGQRSGVRYDGPTLFVSGARSDYVLPEHRPAIRALFPAARFLAVKNAGHWLHADSPEGFASVVESFLARGDQPAPAG